MKTKIIFATVAMMISLNACADSIKVNVHVSGEDGRPVSNAKVKGAFNDLSGNTKFLPSMKDETNDKGDASISGEDFFYTPIWIEKDGYYESYLEVNLNESQTYNVRSLLRSKQNPIAMFAKTVVLNANSNKGRESGEQFGYDLMAGDFVSPNGVGSVGDLLITHTYQKKDSENYSFQILIEFSNPEDGLIPFHFDDAFQQSVFRSAYVAPTQGYRNKWSLNKARHGAGSSITGNFDKARNYYFRVRTETNKQGEIVSAHYGKIYGEFPSITYYLNPTSNDRNLEFDPKLNLFKNLKPEEQAKRP